MRPVAIINKQSLTRAGFQSGHERHTTISTLRATSDSKPSFWTALPNPAYPVRLELEPLWDPPLYTDIKSEWFAQFHRSNKPGVNIHWMNKGQPFSTREIKLSQAIDHSLLESHDFEEMYQFGSKESSRVLLSPMWISGEVDQEAYLGIPTLAPSRP